MTFLFYVAPAGKMYV